MLASSLDGVAADLARSGKVRPASSLWPPSARPPVRVSLGSEPNGRFATGPTAEVVASASGSGTTAAARVEAGRYCQLWYLRGTSEGQGNGTRPYELAVSRHLAVVPGTLERALTDTVRCSVGGLWDAPAGWMGSLEAALRRHRVFPPRSSNSGADLPVSAIVGHAASLGIRVTTNDNDDGAGSSGKRTASAACVVDVRGVAGKLGRGTYGCAFARVQSAHTWQVRLPRDRSGLARIRGYGFAMPLHTRMLPAVDAPSHPAGMGRGAEAGLTSAGGALVAAISAELDTVSGRLQGRLYAGLVASMASWSRDAVPELALSVGWSLVPPARREASKFADVVFRRRLECSFPMLVRKWAAGQDGATKVAPKCGLVWEFEDADFGEG